jgi:uncharacterized membrane protein
MGKIFLGLLFIVFVMAGSWALAQTPGGGMMTEGTHRYGYGMMSGFLGWWALYGLVKAAVVVVGLWLLFRIAKAVERIAASKH